MVASPPSAIDAVASVRHGTLGDAVIVIIKPKPGYLVSVMVGRDMQAVVYSEDGSETFIIKLAPAPDDQVIKIDRDADGTVNVVYSK